MPSKPLVPTLRFPRFVAAWKLKKLGEVAHFFNTKRQALNALQRKKRAGIYPYYGASGIIGYVNDYHLDGEFILLSEDGANIISRKKQLVFVVSGKMWVGNHVHVLRAKGLNTFLAIALSRLNYRKYNTGSVQPKLPLKVCKNISFYVPSLPEQQKISAFLQAINQRINNLVEQLRLWQQYKTHVMRQIFSRRLRFGKGVTSNYAAWQYKTLQQVATFFSGGTPRSTNKHFYTGNIPFIGSGDIGNKTVNKYINSIALQNSSSKLVKQGDLLYALYGATSGTVAISPISGAINQAVLCIRSTENTHYLYQLLAHKKQQITVKYLQGGQGNLSAGIIKNLVLPFPSLAEQAQISYFLRSIDTKITQLNKRLHSSQRFKKVLLQQLFV